ncbi:MAG: hypothetical protein ABW221_27825 [Vicinamibacteria bacterium]
MLEELREIQRRDGGTLGAIVSRLLAQELVRGSKRASVAFSWTARPMEAIVDLTYKDRVHSILG